MSTDFDSISDKSAPGETVSAEGVSDAVREIAGGKVAWSVPHNPGHFDPIVNVPSRIHEQDLPGRVELDPRSFAALGGAFPPPRREITAVTDPTAVAAQRAKLAACEVEQTQHAFMPPRRDEDLLVGGALHAEYAGHDARYDNLSRIFAGADPDLRVAWERGWDEADERIKLQAAILQPETAVTAGALITGEINANTAMLSGAVKLANTDHVTLPDGRNLAEVLAENQRLNSLVKSQRRAIDLALKCFWDIPN
jgi:hypothetical protein